MPTTPRAVIAASSDTVSVTPFEGTADESPIGVQTLLGYSCREIDDSSTYITSKSSSMALLRLDTTCLLCT